MEIDPKTLQQKLASRTPPLVIDVRNPPETQAEGVIEGAKLIPMDQLAARLSEIPPDREVVTVCQKGMRSFNAAGWLRQSGRKAVSMQGGMDAWKALGLPVVTAR
jgi:rhodanese-related sulfurtransferase